MGVNSHPLTSASQVVNYWGQVEDQNLYGQQSPLTKLNTERVGVNCHPLTTASQDINYLGQVDDQNLYGQQYALTELNNELGGVNYHPMNPQAMAKPGEESFSIDFSQSLT